jgi:hypothetical protein
MRAGPWALSLALLACLAHGSSGLDFNIVGGTCTNTAPSSVTTLQAQVCSDHEQSHPGPGAADLQAAHPPLACIMQRVTPCR